MAAEIERLRKHDAEDRQHPLYSQCPEGWLEAQVRANPQILDASLRRGPIYGQVPVFSGPERGIIDLLAIDDTGRLTVIELKATADLQLPFQALDYWLRVRKHLAAGDFERLGYFPAITIRRDAPRILLIAPALEFHSTTETMIGALTQNIEITRIGLAADWRRELRVMFRLRGAERP
jgi:RecB family endonuclease NucS